MLPVNTAFYICGVKNLEHLMTRGSTIDSRDIKLAASTMYLLVCSAYLPLVLMSMQMTSQLYSVVLDLASASQMSDSPPLWSVPALLTVLFVAELLIVSKPQQLRSFKTTAVRLSMLILLAYNVVLNQHSTTVASSSHQSLEYRLYSSSWLYQLSMSMTVYMLLVMLAVSPLLFVAKTMMYSAAASKGQTL